jgi:DNA repair exonuclease SbcCD ATPase subunit
MDSPKSLEDEFEDDDEDDEEDVDEFEEEDDEEESNADEDSSEMTPFEISENFRNLKVNIVMIKAKLKEISEDENSTNNSNFSEQIGDLENKFSESEQKREENKKIILSLMDEIHDLKKREREESTAESEKENSPEISEKIDALLSDKESTIETINLLKEEFKVVQSKIDELQNNSSETVDISSLETNIKQVFDKIDDINSDKSEFKSKIANIESKLEDENFRTNEEIPPPPPAEDPSSSGLTTRVEDLEEIINDATSAIHELSEEFHSFQDEMKELNQESSPTSEKSENFSELEKSIDELRSQMDDLSVEPPPPPPISETINEGASQQLLKSVEELEMQMTDFRKQVHSEIAEFKKNKLSLPTVDKDFSVKTSAENDSVIDNSRPSDVEIIQNTDDANLATSNASSTQLGSEFDKFTFRGMTKSIDEWKQFMLTSTNQVLVNQLKLLNIFKN